MPGNDTVVKSPRGYLPAFWKKVGVTAGQTAGVAMAIAGISKVEIPLARKGSLVSIGVTLTEAVTAGLIRFEVTKNGTATGQTFDMDASSGLKQIWEFDPGVLVGNKGDELGFVWGSSGSLAPSGTIEAVLYAEMQWV